ncbi:MAG: fumarylacetoacetate hydrolase family protein, partial [Candidatus Omnitrophica bacterium]|nr:fumarylacetoacetate hydrolase family protein [Candidatus Omnitrophota bacterium]
MRIVRFLYKKKVYFGVVEDNRIRFLKQPPFGKICLSKIFVSFSEVKILTPVEPTKIILVGLNYRDHARELNMHIPEEPIIFLKPSTACLAHQQAICYPATVNRLDYEAELAVVIRRKAKDISVENSKDYILGYTCLNDVTARDIQKKDGQWTRAKSFDTFCPFGPWIETEFNPNSARIISRLNGIVKQDSNTENIIFKTEFLVSFIS